MKSSVRPGVSRHEYFVLLFLYELTLNHALRVSPAVTRLTVHRRLQVLVPGALWSHGLLYIFW